MIRGICALCLEETELITKSHIIPKFLIRNTVNKGKKGFMVINRGTTQYSKVHDTGYDGHILCENCDNKIIGKYDDYACKFLYGSLGKNKILRGKQYKDYTYLENIDYQKLKYFCLSLLWRSCISTKPSFQLVKMQKKRLEELRSTIRLGPQLKSEDYPVMIYGYLRDKRIPRDIILPPYVSQLKNGQQSFIFIGGGFMIDILIEYKELNEYWKEAMLKDSGKVKIPNVPYEGFAPIFNKIVGVNLLK